MYLLVCFNFHIVFNFLKLRFVVHQNGLKLTSPSGRKWDWSSNKKASSGGCLDFKTIIDNLNLKCVRLNQFDSCAYKLKCIDCI